MRKTLILLFCFLLILSGCSRNIYLGYDKEKGEMLDVGGVLYKNEPITQWEPLNYEDATCIGTVKNYKFSGSYVLYTFNEDIEHVFVMTKDKHSMAYTDTYYYKDDVDLPEFDIKNIEFNGFGSIEFMDDEDSINTTYDRELIDTYLANIMSGDQIHRLNAELADTGRLNAELAGTNYHLVLLSTEYPGIGIDQSVYACRGKFWVTFKGSILIEMPQDILEKIAGRQLPTASEIEEQREEE